MEVVVNSPEEAGFGGKGVIVFVGGGFCGVSIEEHRVGPFFENFSCEGSEFSVALRTYHQSFHEMTVDHRPHPSVPRAVFADSFPEAFSGEEGVFLREGRNGERGPEGFRVEEVSCEFGDLLSGYGCFG